MALGRGATLVAGVLLALTVVAAAAASGSDSSGNTQDSAVVVLGGGNFDSKVSSGSWLVRIADASTHPRRLPSI